MLSRNNKTMGVRWLFADYYPKLRQFILKIV